jgi:hypothetical protein
MRCSCKPKLNGYRDHLPEVKRPERKTEFSRASSGEVKNAWSNTYTFTLIRMAHLVFGISLNPVTIAEYCSHQNADTTVTEPPNPTSQCTEMNFTGTLFLHLIPKPRTQVTTSLHTPPSMSVPFNHRRVNNP